MHILSKYSLAVLSITSLSACNNTNNNNKAPLHEKFTQAAYNTTQAHGITQSERLSGTWILLGQGSQSLEESSLIAGEPRLDESYYSQFNLREVVRIRYDKVNKDYFFTSCDGLGERPLILTEDNVAFTTYGPSLMPLQLNLGDDDNIRAEIKSEESYSATRSATYTLAAKLYKLTSQDNFGSFTFQGQAINPKWSQVMAQNKSFEAQCFAELQGQYTHNNYTVAQTHAKRQLKGEMHTFGIEGPISSKLAHNRSDTSIYVEFSLENDGKNPIKVKAGSNIYANNNNINAIWEIAFDDWQTQFTENEQPDIQWSYKLANSTQVNASFKAAVGSDQAFSVDVNVEI
ncbi:MAG: hypothetical protein HRU20_14170 [Pseudomonadales bacterium]|nr:hypothetical protein [Pseudomonadales bacterium]